MMSMKRLSFVITPLALACILAYSPMVHGQNTVSGGEYRIDEAEPVEGAETFPFSLGTPTTIDNPNMPPARASEEKVATGVIDTTGMTIGPHLLEVGFDSNDGTVRMGPFLPQWFHVTGAKQIMGAEWYIDTDPGEGSATAVSLPNDNAWGDTEESITLTLNGLVSSSLFVGPHTLFIRSKDQDGLWSPASPAPFEVAPPLTIVGAEWVIDLDLSKVLPGDGFAMTAKDGVFDSDVEEVIWTGEDTQGVLPLDVHPVVYVRSLDSLGRWSFWFDPTSPDIPSQVLNRPPSFDPAIPTQVVNPGDLLEFTANITDPDGDGVTLDSFTGPPGATFNEATALFQWTPDIGHGGLHEAVFTATDDFTPPLTAMLAVSIEVANVNRPPVLDAIGDKEVNEGELLEFIVSGSDPDGDNLAYTADNLPPGATFNGNTRTFSWTPGPGTSGTFPGVVFTVTDDGEPSESDSEAITIVVSEGEGEGGGTPPPPTCFGSGPSRLALHGPGEALGDILSIVLVLAVLGGHPWRRRPPWGFRGEFRGHNT